MLCRNMYLDKSISLGRIEATDLSGIVGRLFSSEHFPCDPSLHSLSISPSEMVFPADVTDQLDRYHSGYECTNSYEAIAPPTTLYKV